MGAFDFQGTFAGEAVAVKLFNPESSGYNEAFAKEYLIYQQLRSLQGACVPRLLRFGIFAHINAFFIALSYEGASLEKCAPITPEQHEEMVRIVDEVHRCGHVAQLSCTIISVFK